VSLGCAGRGGLRAGSAVQANKLMGELLHDGEETDAASALQQVMFDSLVFRAACLNACQNHPARCEARANLTTAVELAYQMGDPERVGKVKAQSGAGGPSPHAKPSVGGLHLQAVRTRHVGEKTRARLRTHPTRTPCPFCEQYSWTWFQEDHRACAPAE